MKLKLLNLTLFSLFSLTISGNAASVIISNANDGLTDTLYADSSNNLLSSGIVATGYFSSTIATSDIDTLPELFANLTDFTTITSISFGSESGTLGGIFPGYADQFPNSTTVLGSPIVTGNALLGRTVYTIVTNAASLGAADNTSEFALFQSGVLVGDDPNEVQITATPAGVTPIIGEFDSLTGDLAGQGSSTFTTLKLAAVPEPSALLLSALGVLALLRRKR
jgi:hypothetical protein